MKTIKYINLFAVCLPFIILLSYPIYKEALFIAMYSTMITGLLQILLSSVLIYLKPKNKFIQIYILVVIVFFLLWYFNMNIFYSDSLSVLLFIIPPTLAFYLTFITYKKIES